LAYPFNLSVFKRLSFFCQKLLFLWLQPKESWTRQASPSRLGVADASVFGIYLREKNDDFPVAVAKNVEEVNKLAKVRFECVTHEYDDGGKLFRKRKQILNAIK